MLTFGLSFSLFRLIQMTAPRHIMIGASVFVGYDLLMEFMRHHDELNQRPKVIDHVIAMSVLGTVGGFMASNSIQGAFGGFLFVGINLGLLTWWAMQ